MGISGAIKGSVAVIVGGFFLAALAGPALPATGSPLLASSFTAQPEGLSWEDGSTHGPWRSVYDGFGSNQVVVEEGNKVLAQAPRASLLPDETHAGLVVTRRTFEDIVLHVKAKTVSQLRTVLPNPWETAWVLWNYTDDEHFYYLALKPNGWELGKEDPAYPGAQRYLATGSSPQFPIGPWYTVKIRQVGRTIDVSVDGDHLVSFVDNERPYRSGSVGLYNEDADVRFDAVRVFQP